MSLTRKIFKVIPDTTLRRLRNVPSYFFLTWRWVTWLYALIVILGAGQTYKDSITYNTCLYLLIVTLFQTLIVTLYAPIFQILLPRLGQQPVLNKQRRPRRAPAEGDEPAIMPPLVRTRNRYWDVAIYGLDVLICGLVLYYSGPFGMRPNFGVGSPFYRYGMSTAFAAALAYRYRGGLAAAFGYDLFVLLGIFFPAPGPSYHANIIDITGSLLDTPLSAILAAYIVSLLAHYTVSKKQVQVNARSQKALRNIAEIILRQSGDKQRLLQKSAEAIRSGGHFQRLVIALVLIPSDEEQQEQNIATQKHDDALSLEIETCVDANISVPEPRLPDRDEAFLQQIIQTGKKLKVFERLLDDVSDTPDHYARLYLPFFKNGHVQMVLGAESLRKTPFDSKQEEFLSLAGSQLVIALDNIRLTEQTVELAATAERVRIAREIHDGIAQIVYMLSLNAETCATQAHRIVEASEEDAELITPLAERLDKLVTVSKQALWETRNYMFSLKPLMSGTTTLTEMITTQLREFEAISDLPVQLEVQGNEKSNDEAKQDARRQAQVGAAIFRIVQEALTNAYKHANATQLWVYLTYLPTSIEVDVCDNGCGLQSAYYSYDLSISGDRQRIYSGHGLHGMSDRAKELGGTFELTEMPTGGVKVHAHIPV